MVTTSSQTDLVFHALANRTRRLILDQIKSMPGCCVNDVCEHFEMSRIGVMKHLAVLVDASLVISKKSGRSRALYFNAAPIQVIYDRWTDEYSAFWATQVVDLKHKAESIARKSRMKQAADPNTTGQPANKGFKSNSGVRSKSTQKSRAKTDLKSNIRKTSKPKTKTKPIASNRLSTKPKNQT